MEFAQKIISGQIGILPTDTIFGIVGSALNPAAVERIYSIKGRPSAKPFITLVSNYEQLPMLELGLSPEQRKALETVWPGPVSVVIDCESEEMSYLHRGVRSLAVRMPNNDDLRKLINLTGPLVATSANIAGQPTPTSLEDIRQQLPGMDFYIDGIVGDKPSELRKLNIDGTMSKLNRY